MPLDASGNLYVRTRIHNDAPFEDLETYRLNATTSDNNTSYGIGGILDDGTGTYFGESYTPTIDGSGNLISDASGVVLDDDRPLSVSGNTFNEKAGYIFWSVSGSADQTVKFVGLSGDPSGADPITDLSGQLKYRDPSGNWQSFDASASPVLDASGNLLVRKAVVNDGIYEDLETFNLIIENTGGSDASGGSSLIDNGTGLLPAVDASGNPTVDPSGNISPDPSGVKDDDRALNVSGNTFNEKRGYIFWSVTGVAGQTVRFVNLLVDSSGADLNADLSGNLQYRDLSGNWQTFDASASPVLDASGNLLVRRAVVNDASYEGLEQFKLIVENTGGTDASGISGIIDDGTGLLPALDPSGTPTLDPSGNLSPDPSGVKDDDRGLTVTGSTFNEAAGYIFWTVSGIAGSAGQTVRFVSLLGDSSGADLNADLSGNLQYRDLSGNWQTFDASAAPVLDASGNLLVRRAVVNDATYEGLDQFKLIVENTGGTDASGISGIIDNGTGLFPDGSGNPSLDSSGNFSDATGITKDDDRALTVSGSTFNEGAGYIFWTISGIAGSAGQTVKFVNLLGDSSGADLNADLSGNLQYRELSGNWQTFDASAAPVLDASGNLLVRRAVVNDATYEGLDQFKLIVENTGGTDASGISGIIDNGTGLLPALDPSGTPTLDPSGNLSPDPSGVKDDDRALTVSGSTFNEAAGYIFWTVSGIAGSAGQTVKFVNLLGDSSGADLNADLSGNLQYRDLSGTWQTFDASASPVLDASGNLLVRRAVVNEATYEGLDQFKLIVENTGGTDASGISGIIDDGTGLFPGGSGNPSLDSSGNFSDASGITKDDDRALTVSGSTFNEAAGYIFWTISGIAGSAGQTVKFVNLLGDSSGADLNADLSGNLQYRDLSGNWQTFDASASPVLDASGNLLVRRAVVNDATYEGLEQFKLIVENTGGTDASGISGIIDNGTGLFPDGSGNPSLDPSGNFSDASGVIKDDDRPLTVTGGIYNEGSSFIQWTVTGAAGQRVLFSADPSGITADALVGPSGDITATDLQYFNGSSWLSFDAASDALLDASGTLLIRTRVNNDTINETEANEGFRLIIQNTGGIDASGVSYLNDDGSGVVLDPSGNLDPDVDPDDDRPLTVTGGIYNEGSSFIQWTITGTAGQRVLFSADPSGITADALVGPSGDITAADLQFFNGSSWLSFDAASNALLDASGTLLIRTRVNNDTINETEANEGFRLIIQNTGGIDASGVSYLNDDGSGVVLDPSGNLDPDVDPDDDRPLTVTGGIYNEGSSFIQWTVTGAAGQRVLFSADPSGITADALVGPSGDITAADLQYFNGSSWLSFDAASDALLDASGTLLIRTRVNNDTINETEANEGFRLIIQNTGGIDASGVSYLNDDGSGVVLDPSGNLDPDVDPDDDRPLTITGGTFNEGSSFIQWTITGTAGQRVLFSADPSGITADALVGPSGDITAADLQFFNGSSWLSFDAASDAVLDPSGSLLIRTRVNNDTINETEANEGFRLIIQNTGGIDASGVSYLNDDGSGVVLDPSGNLDPNVDPDDDRPLTVTGGIYNEGSSFIQWTITGTAGQRVLFSADPSGISADALVGPSGDITAADLQYFNGSSWLSFDAASDAVLDPSGSLLIRTRVNNDTINETEANEGFRLIIQNTGGIDASGVSYLNDDGSGVVLDPSGNLDPDVDPDDDRPLIVTGGIYNEGSSFIQWTVTGAAGQRVLFSADPSGITADALVGPSGDITAADLQYFNGSSWLSFDAASDALLDASGTLLIRTRVNNDTINETEANEGFRLIIQNTGGIDASGVSYLNDDGSGVVLDPSGNLDPDVDPDDDRPLTITGGTFNEGSSFIQWTITGTAGQRVLFSADPSGISADALVGPSGDITATDLEYFNGTSWLSFDPSSNAVLDPSGSLLIRTRVNNDTISETEANEGFRLIIQNTGGIDASGISYLNDDGSGVVLDPSGNLDPDVDPDDDRPLIVTGGIYNEGSSFIQWTVTGAAGQRVLFSADPSGITADALVGPSGDITATDLEYFNGTSWLSFDPSSNAVLDPSGSLLIRTRVNNDTISETKANEGFRLIIQNTGGIDASGISYLNDDGSGVVLDPSGNLDPDVDPDDDRPLIVTGGIYNEGSSFIQWTVTGAAGQRVLFSADPSGITADALVGPSGDITATDLEFVNGSSWLSFDATSNALLDASGTLLIRTRVNNDTINETEANEGFRLIIQNTGGIDASGVSYLNDDGSGVVLDPSGNLDPDVDPDDDRPLTVSGGTFNEGSSFIQWTVTGAAGQRVLFSADPSGITADALVGPSGDITATDLQYFNGSSWLSFDAASNALLDASGTLLIRTRVNNDTINETEANEGFRLIIQNTGGIDASGVSYLNDDGSGVVLDPSGNLDPDVDPDDDRPLTVTGGTFNEGSSFIQWTVTGAAGQRVLFSADPSGITADALVGPSGDITATDLEYFNGTSWLSFDPSSNAVLDPSGSLLIRTRVNNDTINETEANEGFRLIIQNTGGIDASGVSYLNDDGSGVVLDPSGNLDPDVDPDDDRPLTITGGTFNEGSSFIQWTITGAAGQRVLFSADPSGISADALVGPSGDITATDLEYFNGSSWLSFDAASDAVLDPSGSLLIRTRVNNDTINETEVNEGFRLIIQNTGGIDASGVSYLNDDGSGVVLDPSGNLDPDVDPDDDRPLTVTGGTFNEGSSFIQWTVTGAAGQRVLFSADPSGITADALVGPSGDITATDLQYFNGSSWLSFDAASNALLDASGTLLIRTRVNNDTINETEANEGFRLIIQNTGGIDASGVSYLNDDGSGVVLDPSGNLDPDVDPDDDRPLTVTGGTFNEGSSHVFWTISGVAGQVVSVAGLTGDPSGTARPNDPSGDLTGNLEYLSSSSTWVLFDAGAELDSSGALLIRKAIINDNVYEGEEDFELNVAYATGNKNGSGVSSLIDDGTGLVVDGSGSVSSSIPDDDRILSINGEIYNEASSYIFWTINGTAGQLVGLNSLKGYPSGTALPDDPSGDLTATLQYRNGAGQWVTFDASGAELDSSGSLLIRKAINNDQAYEGMEDFELAIGYLKGTDFDSSGVSSLIDDGTGLVVDGSGNNIGGNPDDDRMLSIKGEIYNEGSSHIFWKVNGTAGLLVGLNSLLGDPSAAALPGDPSGDLTGDLEYRTSSGAWVKFDTSGATLDASGTLLIRKEINNDDRFEGQEDFALSVGYRAGATFESSGVSSLIDDGTGALVDGSGIPTGGTLDDDSTLTVNNIRVNEGSPNAIFTVRGSVGQTVFLSIEDASGNNPIVDPTGGLAELGTSPVLQYRDGSGIWQTYNEINPPVISDPSGFLFARVAISAEQETAFDGTETFNLIASNTSGSAFSGSATVFDDGTGDYWIGDNADRATPEQLEASRISLDDDRTLRVTAYSPVNEASTYAMFAVTAVPGQSLELTLGNTSSLLDVDATITGFTTEWSLDGSDWTESNSVQAVPDSGIVFVRVRITSEADNLFEGAEAFTQSATYTSGAPLRATGIANIVDNGTGELFTGGFTNTQPELIDGRRDDDRSVLSIPDVNVNEASPYVVFQVSANAGQFFTLALSDGAIGFSGENDNPADRDRQQAVASYDYLNRIEIYNGKVWTSYTPGDQASIPTGGSVLLVRVPMINDTIYEGAHAFSLTATPPTGSSATGRAIIGDFGTGLIFNDSGAEDRKALKDDDRQLKVDSPIVNEGSEHVVFQLTGIVGPIELALQDIGIGTGFADLSAPNLQYWGGSSWQSYEGTAITPGTDFESGSILLVRVAISEEQDTMREGAERFTLRVSGDGGPSLGTATIRDDGTGLVWLGNSLTPATTEQLSIAEIVLDDDFDLDGITPTTEEALATLAASQGVGGSPGDHNDDGIADALQNALATLAWRTVEDFKSGNDGTLTDVEPIISLAALSDGSNNNVSETLQLQNIRVVDYADTSQFGSAADDVSIDENTGMRMVTLASGGVVTTPWDPIRFDVVPQAGNNELDDSSTRDGTQVRLFIDVRASNLNASAFNAYIKFVSQATITAAGQGAITDLDGNAITKEGWYNFTQRSSGGDGARFIVDNGKITGIELILTDNAFGDSNALLNKIQDPGVPVLIADVRLVPTADGKGLEVVGGPGQVLWADFSAVLADAKLQNSFNLVRISSTGEQAPIGAIGATPDSGFLGDLRVQLRVGDVVRFSQVSSNLPANPQPDVSVSGEDDCIIVRLDDDGGDGDGDDLMLKVKTSDSDPYPRKSQMSSFQTSSEQAYLDLSWIGAEGITLNVDLQADAGQTNTIRLVRVDTDAEGRPLGTVGGVAPTAGAAFDAKIRELALPGLSYSLSETATASVSWQLTGAQAGVYAPVLFTERGDVFSFGAISSSDRRQHVKVLGTSSFGFEDARNGRADWDYNDAVATFNVADPTTPRLELSSDGHGLTVVGGSGSAEGLWLDLNAVLAEAGNQNSFDLFVLDASGSRSQAGSVGATSNGAFLGAKELFLGVGETLLFVQNSNDDQPTAAVDLRITKIGERYRVALEDEATTGDGDYNDLVIDVDRSPLEPCEQVVQLASLQTSSSAGLLDLSKIGAEGLKLNLAIQTESGNNNTLGFVKLDSSSSNGLYSVDGVAAANTDAFRQAVRDNLIDFRISAGGRGEDEPKVWQLVTADQGIYAAVLLNPDNEVFTFGDATSADGRQHLKVLGDNSIGFEDLLASKGSDFDYDDFVVRITPL